MALILFKTLVIICGLQLLRHAVLVDQRERLKHFDCRQTGQVMSLLKRQMCGRRWQVEVVEYDIRSSSLICAWLRFRLLGLSMAMAIGPLAEVSAYAFAPQSLLAPLDGFDVIWNILPQPELAHRKLTTILTRASGSPKPSHCFFVLAVLLDTVKSLCKACTLHFG